MTGQEVALGCAENAEIAVSGGAFSIEAGQSGVDGGKRRVNRDRTFTGAGGGSRGSAHKVQPLGLGKTRSPWAKARWISSQVNLLPNSGFTPTISVLSVAFSRAPRARIQWVDWLIQVVF